VKAPQGPHLSSKPGSLNSYSVNQLEDVVLFCNIDTIMQDFIDPKSKQAKLQMI